MNNKMNGSMAEQLIDQAKTWLKTSQRDYQDYKKLVRLGWLPFIYKEPDEPQGPIYHLQQCVEKIIKAIALASGKFSSDDIMNYGHDSLRLYIDIELKLVNIPLAQIFLDTMQGRIFRQSKAELYGYDEAERRLNELREKAKLGSAAKEMNEWAYEFATLPREDILKLVNSQRKAIRNAKRGRFLLHLITMPMRWLTRSRADSGKVYSKLLVSLNKQGFLLSDNLKVFFRKKEIVSFISNKTDEQKLSLIWRLGDLLLFASISSALFVLAALTYAHAISPKYPGDLAGVGGVRRKLNSESYNRSLGLIGAVINVGKLTSDVLGESEREIALINDIFNFFDNNLGFLVPKANTN